MSSNFWSGTKEISSRQAEGNRTQPRVTLQKGLWACILCVLIEKMRKRPSAAAGFMERCLLSAALSVPT
jgi:hypothetical protein